MTDRRGTRRGLTRRELLATLLACGSAALLAGCQPAAAPAKPAPAPAAATPTAATGAAPPQAATAGLPPAAPAAWEQQWNDLIAAARQEGRIVVVGPPDPNLRTALPAKFKERFGVELEYLAMPASQAEFLNRLAQERNSGAASADVFVAGGQSLYSVGYPEKIMAPMRPVLFHLDAVDATKWVVGKVWFRDPDDQYFMQIERFVFGSIVVNKDYVNPRDITSWQDLLKPEYTGKISVWEPRVPGPGSVVAWWIMNQFGEDYFKRLYVDQKPVIVMDFRQWGDMVARGTTPIGVALDPRDTKNLINEGFPVEPLFPPEAPGFLTGGYGLVTLVANAKNPNAAKLFVNWIATREGQEAWHRATETPSIRTDLDNSWAPSFMVPKPGVDYFDDYEWEHTLRAVRESFPKIRGVMGER